jgi:hypothetical protein
MDLDLEKIIAHEHLPRLDPFGGRAEEGSRAHAAVGHNEGHADARR